MLLRFHTELDKVCVFCASFEYIYVKISEKPLWALQDLNL